MINRAPTSPKRPAAGAPGVKLLITAASLAATLGGWAAFTLGANGPSIAAGTTQSSAAAMASLPPIPTVMPPPADLANGQALSTAPKMLAPPVLRQVQLPFPMAITRSSR